MKVRLQKQFFGPDQKRHAAGKIIDIPDECFSPKFMEKLEDSPKGKKSKSKVVERDEPQEEVEKVEPSVEEHGASSFEVI